MRSAATVARILMGAAFVVFGLNGFLHFLPNPELPPPARALMGALVQTGYFMKLVMATAVVAGALLLTGIAVPLALVLIAPVLVNIFCFHLFLAPGSIGPALVLSACELLLAWQHRSRFRALFA